MTIPIPTDSHQHERPCARVTFPAGAHDSQWRPFVPGSGYVVYVLVNTDRDVLYVGQTKNPGARLRNHYRNQDWWPEVAGIELHLVADEIEARKLEVHLDELLRPRCSSVTAFDALRLARLAGDVA